MGNTGSSGSEDKRESSSIEVDIDDSDSRTRDARTRRKNNGSISLKKKNNGRRTNSFFESKSHKQFKKTKPKPLYLESIEEMNGGHLIVGKKLITSDPGRVTKAWCSWCYNRCMHGRTSKNILPLVRSVYKCQECSHRTIPCRFCEEMARGHTDWDDELCSVCNGSIESWVDSKKEDVRSMGFCSWCFHLNSHTLRDTSLIFRDSYVCEACGGPTALCVSCKRAFSKCSSFYNELLCAKCDGSIDSWADIEENIKKQTRRGNVLRETVSPFTSFSPRRKDQAAFPIIDGKEFYQVLYDGLIAAETSIYMSFWHFNYFIFLKKSEDGNWVDKYRIDNVLKKKAEEGVMIYIILWREALPQLQCNNFSLEMKRYIKSLHPNIHCIRHGHPTPLNIYVSHHQKFVVIDQEMALVGGLDVCLGRYDDESHRLTDTKSQTWRGVDYYNPHIVRPTIETPFEDVIDRQSCPRMPWHDVDVLVYGDTARDVARNFIGRWNHHIDIAYPHKNLPKLQINRHKSTNKKFPSKGTCFCQVVRSMDQWSGSHRLEQSIYGAYLEAISVAEYFIYIENQYLSSSLAGGGVENIVMQRILEKLRSKINMGERFRLYLVLPQPEEVGRDALEILRWQYQTLNRGGSSILEQLTEEFPDVDLEEYIGIFFLRNYDFLNGIPVTEKNDRSFLGHMDSELGVVVEDADLVNMKMDGRPFLGGNFCHTLRRRLWMEHLGFKQGCKEEAMLQDPICDEVFNNMWMAFSKRNTEIYERVFPSIPSNRHQTMKQFEADKGLDMPYIAVTDGEELRDIQGFVTLHPIGFMMEESMESITASIIGLKWWQ